MSTQASPLDKLIEVGELLQHEEGSQSTKDHLIEAYNCNAEIDKSSQKLLAQLKDLEALREDLELELISKAV